MVRIWVLKHENLRNLYRISFIFSNIFMANELSPIDQSGAKLSESLAISEGKVLAVQNSAMNPYPLTWTL